MKTKYFFVIIVFLLSLFILSNVAEVEAAQSGPLPTTNINIRLQDIEGLYLYYDAPCLGDCGPERSFDFKTSGGFLEDGETKIRLDRLSALTSSLHTLYPGTRNVHYLGWTDYYPHARVIFYLDDGRIVTIESSSQFARMVPWNVKVWQKDEEGEIELVGSYVALHDGIHTGLSVIWQDIFGKNFPNDDTLEEWLERSYLEEEQTSIFLNYENMEFDQSFPIEAGVIGLPSGVLDPFLEILAKNDTLNDLFGMGFEVYDAVFGLHVPIENSHPLDYGGMLALKAPDSPDVVVGTVTISLEPVVEVETSFSLEEVEAAISKRQSRSFLNETHNLLPGIVYLSDLRRDQSYPEFGKLRRVVCAADHSYKNNDYIIEAVLTEYEYSRMTLYSLAEKDAWSVDFDMDRKWGNWDDDLIGLLLKAWWPSEFEDVDPAGLDKVSTHFQLKFFSGFFNDKPELFDLIVNTLPPEVSIHTEHPQKEGDQTVFRLNGRLVLPEDGSEPYVINCGVDDPPFNGERVNVPSNPPTESLGEIGSPGDWIKTQGLPFTTVSKRDIHWTSIGSSSPGLIHILWTTKDAVYYSEGNVDGTNWTKPQKLSDYSWSMQVATNAAGDLHLIWSTHYPPRGTMHLWKPAGGEWQEPEHWERVQYFSDVILGEDNRLHLAWSTSDGLDEEFFYADWTSNEGLSSAENVSRRIGDIGSSSIRINLDASGKVHAVWAHPLIEVEYFDPLTGESYAEKGIFYASRNRNGSWTIPELIGYLAPFSHSFDFDITSNNEIVVVWQNTEGIVASQRQSTNNWSEPVMLHEVIPPEEPDPFGPGRWVVPTAIIQMDKNSEGDLLTGWLLGNKGIYLTVYRDDGYDDPKTIYVAEEGKSISHDFDIAATKDFVHFLFYLNNSLTYANYNLKNENDLIAAKSFGIRYDSYGSPAASLIADDAGFVYVLGLPKEPAWTVFIPEGGIPKKVTREPQPTPSETVAIDSPELPLDDSVQPSASPGVSAMSLFGVIVFLTLAGYLMVRKPRKARNER